jgi:hypothetical protein
MLIQTCAENSLINFLMIYDIRCLKGLDRVYLHSWVLYQLVGKSPTKSCKHKSACDLKGSFQHFNNIY